MKMKIKDQRGAASILEACIIYPVILIVVLALFFMSLLYIQNAYLQKEADRIASYISRCIAYPGYDMIDTDVFDGYLDVPNDKTSVSLDDMTEICKRIDPYRYIAGVFGYTSLQATGSRENLLETIPNKLVNEVLPYSGMLKSVNVEFDGKKDMPGYKVVVQGNGYICGINASNSMVKVRIKEAYLALPGISYFVGHDTYFTMSAEGTSKVSDTGEFIRNTDFVYDVATYWIDKMGINLDKVMEFINKFKN